jgi:hypothetical protein
MTAAHIPDYSGELRRPDLMGFIAAGYLQRYHAGIEKFEHQASNQDRR